MLNYNKDNMNEIIFDLSDFINKSKTPWHAVEFVKEKLLHKGFIELDESCHWKLDLNTGYFCIKDESSLITFRTPKNNNNLMTSLWYGAHTDSPCLKLKHNYLQYKEGYQTAEVEIYGGPMINSWFDRDLNIAGRLICQSNNGDLISKRFTSDLIVRIPQLAIHLDKKVNKEGFKTNPQTQMVPIIGLEDTDSDFKYCVESFLEDGEEIIDFDLILCDSHDVSLAGAKKEFISGPRLDDLLMVHGGLQAFIDSDFSESSITGCAFFNHEEIGSVSFNGADSFYFNSILERIYTGLDLSREDYLRGLSKSFMVSADVVHAINPGFVDRYDENHLSRINSGLTIKRNANMKYATDAFSSAIFRRWCKNTNVSCQDFFVRNDIGAGSTLGPKLAANSCMQTVDIGSPLLSMHSIREMAGVEDHKDLINVMAYAFKNF